jgi:succinyl-CoA synthetase alpha subunit
MAILIDAAKKVLVQGITGREGLARLPLMMDYGTRVVGGCTPGRGGGQVLGLPVFNTVHEAVSHLGPLDVSCLFVPGPQVKSAALEAIDVGVPLLVLIADRVPLYDVLEIVEAAERVGASFVGPNTIGVISPDQAVLGMIGGSARNARELYRRGPVGVVSRSGGLSASAGYYLRNAGLGVSTIVHVGGDSVVGLSLPDVVRLFQADPETRIIALVGEIGGTQEERVAEMIASGEVTKPVVAYIGGRSARPGTRYSHAGAIVEGHRGTWQSKVDTLHEAGARVVESFGDLGAATASVVLS